MQQEIIVSRWPVETRMSGWKLKSKVKLKDYLSKAKRKATYSMQCFLCEIKEFNIWDDDNNDNNNNNLCSIIVVTFTNWNLHANITTINGKKINK